MTMKKISIIVVACILLLSSLTVLASQNGFGPSTCCFSFFSDTLPEKRVVDFKYTHKMCSVKGVILTMRNGARFCVDPTQAWVKTIIKAKEAEQRQTSSVRTNRSSN